MKLISPKIGHIIAESVTKNDSTEEEDTWATVCHGRKDFTDHFITKIKTSDDARTRQSLVYRYGFLKKLIDLLPAGITHFGKSLVAFDAAVNADQATMVFEDGELVEVDAILGCDGIHSRVIPNI